MVERMGASQLGEPTADEQAAQKLTQIAKELRSKPGSQLAKCLPNDPEVSTGHVPLVFKKAPAPAHA